MVMLKPRDRNMLAIRRAESILESRTPLIRSFHNSCCFNNQGNFLFKEVTDELPNSSAIMEVSSLGLSEGQVAYLFTVASNNNIYLIDITNKDTIRGRYYWSNSKHFLFVFDEKDKIEEPPYRDSYTITEYENSFNGRLPKREIELSARYNIPDASGYNVELKRSKLYAKLVQVKIKQLDDEKRFSKQKERLNKLIKLTQEYQSLTVLDKILEVDLSYWRAETELMSALGKKLNNFRTKLNYYFQHTVNTKSVLKYYRSTYSSIISSMKKEAKYQLSVKNTTPRQMEILNEIMSI